MKSIDSVNWELRVQKDQSTPQKKGMKKSAGK